MGLWPLALLAMGGLALLVRDATGWRGALWLGWLFGMGHFTLGNSWIATAFTYQANMPAVLGWAAVPLLSVYLAIYPALAAAGTRLLAKNRGGAVLALAFAGCWIIAEWLRSWVFTGYAWNPFGIVLLGPFDRPGLAALAPYMGTYALSGLAVLVGTALMHLLDRGAWLRSALAALLLVVGMYLPAGKGEEGTLAVTVVQPDIRQPRLADPRFNETNFLRLAQLSAPERDVPARLVAVARIGHARLSRKRLSAALLRRHHRARQPRICPCPAGAHDRAERRAADRRDRAGDRPRRDRLCPRAGRLQHGHRDR